jgi:hypothetical protein
MDTDKLGNVGQYLPSINDVRSYTELFSQYGPYLVAILLLLLGISLCFVPSRIIRVLGITCFAASLGAIILALMDYSESATQRRDPDMRYVIEAEFLAQGELARSIDRIDPRGLTSNKPIGYVIISEKNRVRFLVLSQEPINDKTLKFIYIFIRNAAHAEVACISTIQQMHEIKFGIPEMQQEGALNNEQRLLQYDDKQRKWVPLDTGCMQEVAR